MKLIILVVFVVVVATISAVPLGPDNIEVDQQGNLFYNELTPLERVPRQSGDFIKAGAVHSSQYGGGGQIVANKNLASSGHHSVDAQAKYTQYGRHKEGWAGINYSVSW